MSIRQAVRSDLEAIKRIVVTAISEVYPHYYPKGAVEFFMDHHKEDNMICDLQQNRIFLCMDAMQNTVGTITIKENEICRLFVLPSCQGSGYGTQLLDYAETEIARRYKRAVLDASLPAKEMYRKRGYRETESHKIAVSYGDFLCYDVMEKQL